MKTLRWQVLVHFVNSGGLFFSFIINKTILSEIQRPCIVFKNKLPICQLYLIFILFIWFVFFILFALFIFFYFFSLFCFICFLYFVYLICFLYFICFFFFILFYLFSLFCLFDLVPFIDFDIRVTYSPLPNFKAPANPLITTTGWE